MVHDRKHFTQAPAPRVVYDRVRERVDITSPNSFQLTRGGCLDVHLSRAIERRETQRRRGQIREFSNPVQCALHPKLRCACTDDKFPRPAHPRRMITDIRAASAPSHGLPFVYFPPRDYLPHVYHGGTRLLPGLTRRERDRAIHQHRRVGRDAARTTTVRMTSRTTRRNNYY